MTLLLLAAHRTAAHRSRSQPSLLEQTCCSPSIERRACNPCSYRTGFSHAHQARGVASLIEPAVSTPDCTLDLDRLVRQLASPIA